LRTATPPSGSAAHSTQLPLGLLRPLFCHVTPCNSPAGMPLAMRFIWCSLRFGSGRRSTGDVATLCS
jgi:hypothetical protein